jgi:hypothetical protein
LPRFLPPVARRVGTVARLSGSDEERGDEPLGVRVRGAGRRPMSPPDGDGVQCSFEARADAVLPKRVMTGVMMAASPFAVMVGYGRSTPTFGLCPRRPPTPAMKGCTTAKSPRRLAVMVRSGSSEPCTRLSPAWLTGTMNGSAELMTKRRMPSAMRRSVFSASGFLRSKIDGQARLQSMHSAAVR